MSMCVHGHVVRVDGLPGKRPHHVPDQYLGSFLQQRCWGQVTGAQGIYVLLGWQKGRMQSSGSQRKNIATNNPITKSLTRSGAALIWCTKAVRVSEAGKFGIRAQLGTTEPEGELEVELCNRWVSGNGSLALGHQQESARLVWFRFYLVVCF